DSVGCWSQPIALHSIQPREFQKDTDHNRSFMPRLTEQEQQEIIRYIESDKPLPERFRFLLFEEKREVELVWNGKSSDVNNIVLPFQVIEQVDEPRAEKPEDTLPQGLLFGERGRQLKAGPISSSGAITNSSSPR